MGKFSNKKIIISSDFQNNSTTRRCYKCEAVKLVKEFHKNQRMCKPCKKIYRHEYYEANKKRENALATKYWKEHPGLNRHYRHVNYGYKPRFKSCDMC